MSFRLSERTSNSKALSTICRLLLRRVSFLALRTRVAITTWAGHGVFDQNSQPQILTLWHLVVSIADETNPKNQWETVMAGADTFFR
jgi:hypothetical protein